MTGARRNYRCVVLAGERPGGNPLTHHFSVSTGVMVPVAGKPSLERVLNTLDASLETDSGIICGPANKVIEHDPKLKKLLRDSSLEWLKPAAGPAASALSALKQLGHLPALLTTGDHALLTPEIIDEFCRQALTQKADYDLVIGFVPYELVRTAWPESRRTVLKFSDGGFCGANLFAVLDPEGGNALEFWSEVEDLRKKPWKIARRIGFGVLLRYLFKRLTLEDTLSALSRVSGCRIGHVQLDFARAAVDVDSVADQQLAEGILSAD